MDYIGQHFDRKVYWLDYDKFSADKLPDKDWICLAVANTNPDSYNFDKFVRASIDSGIVEFKGHGTFGEKLHDLFDETMSVMEVMEKHSEIGVMTTWHNRQTLADAFWQCFFATCLPDTVDYDNIKVVCTDLDSVDRRQELKDYLDRFNKGWLPSSDDNDNQKIKKNA